MEGHLTKCHVEIASELSEQAELDGQGVARPVQHQVFESSCPSDLLPVAFSVLAPLPGVSRFITRTCRDVPDASSDPACTTISTRTSC